MNERPIGDYLTHLQGQTLRIIDANLDRTAEGLRVLEDVSRFYLDSSLISKRLKSLRHRLLENCHFSTAELLSARDSAGDVGRESEAVKRSAGDIGETVTANARRVEQSLRVLEEMARLPEITIDGAVFETIRYAVYDIEKELTVLLSRQAKTSRLSGRYTTAGNMDDVTAALAEGSQSVQLDPGSLKRCDLWGLATETRKRCNNAGALFIIGEFADIAVAVKADGVAIDGGSLPPPVVRGLLAIDQLIGYAAMNVEEAVSAESGGADYVLCSDTLKDELTGKIGIPIVVPARNGVR
ncbi:thiamine phosphate synthase [Dehalogenimonas sp. THU2]|uniref:thiamine phosphate synthase n=1 Tax=Dehalogenimonas sp. THU2 TaxID=3151121 RepID=UPI0032196622